MNRRIAILLGSLIAALAAAESITLSAILASERHDDRERYERAITSQRRAAGRTPLAVRSEAGLSQRTLCVTGVQTFATAVARALFPDIVTAGRRLDTSDLQKLSNRAIQAERYVEQATAGPALPQRMGRTRITDPDAETPTWRPIEPARVPCEGEDAYARFRLQAERVPEPAPSNLPSDG